MGSKWEISERKRGAFWEEKKQGTAVTDDDDDDERRRRRRPLLGTENTNSFLSPYS